MEAAAPEKQRLPHPNHLAAAKQRGFPPLQTAHHLLNLAELVPQIGLYLPVLLCFQHFKVLGVNVNSG